MYSKYVISGFCTNITHPQHFLNLSHPLFLSPPQTFRLELAIFSVLLHCILSAHIYLFSILSSYSSSFASTEMSLEEAPLKGKWRLNMSRLRLWDQYVFEQMGLSINSGWCKWAGQACFSQKALTHRGNCTGPAMTTHQNNLCKRQPPFS